MNLIGLLDKKFLNLEELKEVEMNENVKMIDNCGNSGYHNGYIWYVITLNNNEEYSVYSE